MSSSSASGTGIKSESLTDRFLRGTSLVESSPSEALSVLESVQKDSEALSLFSPDDGLEDVSTKSLPLLAVDHFLATAIFAMPASPDQMDHRKASIMKAFDLWSSFLGKLERLELLSRDDKNTYHQLIEEMESSGPPPPNREEKIARYKAKKEISAEIERLRSLKKRRQRLGASENDEFDGFDEEGLERETVLRQLALYAADALESWASAKRELPMIELMIQRTQESQNMARHTGDRNVKNGPGDRPTANRQPLQVTHITKNPQSGQLVMQREEIKSKVFRPGWNQPTMTLEELGAIEMERALEREENQKVAEAERAQGPQRYEQLVKAGLEDNADLVDASAQLDREWDDFKDENPRGIGNKRGDVGDRNF